MLGPREGPLYHKWAWFGQLKYSDTPALTAKVCSYSALELGGGAVIYNELYMMRTYSAEGEMKHQHFALW